VQRDEYDLQLFSDGWMFFGRRCVDRPAALSFGEELRADLAPVEPPASSWLHLKVNDGVPAGRH
jgi:hypothetical protein